MGNKLARKHTIYEICMRLLAVHASFFSTIEVITLTESFGKVPETSAVVGMLATSDAAAFYVMIQLQTTGIKHAAKVHYSNKQH